MLTEQFNNQLMSHILETILFEDKILFESFYWGILYQYFELVLVKIPENVLTFEKQYSIR